MEMGCAFESLSLERNDEAAHQFRLYDRTRPYFPGMPSLLWSVGMTVGSPFRRLTIIAKDPGLRIGPNQTLAFAQVDVAAERLAKGPIGYRIKVVDYNATERLVYDNDCNYQTRKGTHEIGRAHV